MLMTGIDFKWKDKKTDLRESITFLALSVTTSRFWNASVTTFHCPSLFKIYKQETKGLVIATVTVITELSNECYKNIRLVPVSQYMYTSWWR